MDCQAVADKLRQLPREGLVRVLYDTVPWNKRDDYKTKIMDPAIASSARLDAPLERISYSSDMFAELSRDVIAADWDYWSTGPRTPAAERRPYKGIAGFGHLDRLLDAGFQVIGFPSSCHAFNAERCSIDHSLALANVTAFARELRRRHCLGMVNTFWPTDALGQAWWHDLQFVSHTRRATRQSTSPGRGVQAALRRRASPGGANPVCR